MPMLLVIAALAQAIKVNDLKATAHMLAILEERLDIEEVFALLDDLAPKMPPPPPSLSRTPRTVLCA